MRKYSSTGRSAELLSYRRLNDLRFLVYDTMLAVTNRVVGRLTCLIG